MTREKTLIGRAEKVKFTELGDLVLHARIDTGATTSSVGIISAAETTEGLRVVFATDEYKAGAIKVFPHYERVVVASSMGHQQTRYKVRLSMIMRRRRIRATFTLADRSSQVYPVLIGRRALNQKFIVDVSMGSPLRDKEQERSDKLQSTVISEDKV